MSLGTCKYKLITVFLNCNYYYLVYLVFLLFLQVALLPVKSMWTCLKRASDFHSSSRKYNYVNYLTTLGTVCNVQGIIQGIKGRHSLPSPFHLGIYRDLNASFSIAPYFELCPSLK